MKRLFFLSLIILLAASLSADISYTFTSSTKAETQSGSMSMNGTVYLKEPALFRVEFTESDNPMMGTGTFMVSNDGKAIYLVNPQEKTYTRFDAESLSQSLGSLMQSLGEMVEISIEDVKVNHTRGSNDQTLLGYPCEHHLVNSSYRMKVKVLFMKQVSDQKSKKEVWTTQAIELPIRDLFQESRMKTGFADLDKLIEAESRTAVPGFMLKSIITTVSEDKKGKTTTTIQNYDVTSIKTESLADDLFLLPEGYREVPLIPTMQSDEGNDKEEGGKKKSIFDMFKS
ncbi:MAG TPA: DUF4412 domain-containing protein [Thermoanaerobaculia bacterium]|nr:DUF4412 domain-containing protein [Thermoanaerobaculia bacterium]HUM29912.1 DUF4412 domain-containing protein [Thermoanaerobaculia bacterium]HXK68221.1 DUF4412 domain-containing protein [Thermoanaerobaculia bacterium]